jgi:hypothetical protein
MILGIPLKGEEEAIKNAYTARLRGLTKKLVTG